MCSVQKHRDIPIFLKRNICPLYSFWKISFWRFPDKNIIPAPINLFYWRLEVSLKKSPCSRDSLKSNLAAKYLKISPWMEIKSFFFFQVETVNRLFDLIRKQTGGISVFFTEIKDIWRPNPKPWWVPDSSFITLLERAKLMSFYSEFFPMQFFIKIE